MPLVDQRGKLAGLGQVINPHAMLAGSINPAALPLGMPEPAGHNVMPAPAERSRPAVSEPPRPAQLYPGPEHRVAAPPAGWAPYSRAVPVPLDSGLPRGGEYGQPTVPIADDPRWLDRERYASAVPQRGVRTVASDAGIRDWRERVAERQLAPDHDGPVRIADQDAKPRLVRDGPPVTALCECGCLKVLSKPARGPMPRWHSDACRMRAGRRKAQLAELTARGFAVPGEGDRGEIPPSPEAQR